MPAPHRFNEASRLGQPHTLAASIHGETKRWLSWDPGRVATAAALSYLTAPHAGQAWELTLATELSETCQRPGFSLGQCLADDISLCLWVPEDLGQLAEVATTIDNCRRQSPGRRRIVYLPNSTADQRLLMLESGAQIIDSQLPSLLRSLATAMTAAGNSVCGNHRFTRGLLDRLPWQ